MKKILITLAFLAINLFAATAQTADETAIRKAIEDETKAFHFNTDRSVFFSYWNITTPTVMAFSGATSAMVLTGSQMNESAKNGTIPPADGSTTTYENFYVKSDGNIGWAVYTQIETNKEGKVSKYKEFRLMEKINGAWKIASSSVHELK